jgi:hypothetical protein
MLQRRAEKLFRIFIVAIMRMNNSPSEKQVPRPPRPAAEAAEIRVQNRRREYLRRNPEYFKDPEHEFAGMFYVQRRRSLQVYKGVRGTDLTIRSRPV